jgi:hypothetical protein
MDDGSFYDEGLVAAALGVRSGQNPYWDGTIAHRKWSEGFISYERGEDDELAGDRQFEGAETH